jgi:alcohol dehydrogenase class IV
MSAQTEFTLQLPAHAVFGAGTSAKTGEEIARLGASKALLVTDDFLLGNGAAERFRGAIESAGFGCETFSGVQPDPTDRNVADGLEALRRADADVVVAFGGGSVLDAAKMIAIMARNEGQLREYRGYHQIPAAGVPLIAVPTTAGTGSEATRVAVITDTENDEKLMILDGHLVPDVAIVDFELSATMPPALTAFVGVDTLTHGVEAYTSRLANPLTDALALSCVRLVGKHLERAFAVPDDAEARAGMALAAYAGGAAFANASVALVHGMSRPLGAVFHVPHGLSNAVLLPTVVGFSLEGAPGRYAELARAVGFASDSDDVEAAGARMVAGLTELNQRLGVPALGALEQVERERFEAGVEKMAADALASGSPDRNPVVPSAEQIVALYKEAF